MSLLEKALQEGNYELAALAIVYGMLKMVHGAHQVLYQFGRQQAAQGCHRQGV